jgi:hypothetical protein
MATYQLRALSIGEILDGAFAVYRGNFGVLVGISAICTGIPAIINVYMSTVGIEFISVWIMLVGFGLYSVGGLIATGATIHVISEAYLSVMPSLGEALKFALGKMLKIFLAGLCKYLIIGVVVVIVMIVFGIAGAAMGGSTAAAALVTIGVIPVAIIVFVMLSGYSIVTQAAVLEWETSAVDSLARSWTLTKGFKMKAFGLGAVIWILVSIPVMAGTVLIMILPGMAAVLSAASSLLQLILYPVVASTFTLLYYDLRVRKEAFDIEYLGQQLGVATDLE